ncbi:SdpI family protein [Mesonia ostreae]|uniref:SdpI family protein n=1 Tax=Mesonia ostreae TaxID=861110 RepID=A0ABU2KGG3_9FLAO|nr:SdpI family protein [Mesonia ostreae]MDT0293800.1 SdpI family protein [Mesonia ostreae]
MESTVVGPFLLLDAFTGVVFILLGWVLYKYPPKEINSLYGYRTSKSMKSQEAWDFAQQYSGKLMVKTGAFLLVVGVLGAYLIPISFIWEIFVAIFAFSIAILALFYFTESELDQIT